MKYINLSKEERRRIQLLELEILQEVDRICKKNKIHYTMGYGSLIGTIRHNGFIPWDDDIDICFLRKDYIKFKEICKIELSSRFFYQSNDTDPEYFFLWDKIRLNGTVFRESYLSSYNIHHGIYLDIFPIDYIPDNKIKQYFQYLCFQFFKSALMSKYLILHSRNGCKKYIAAILRFFFYFIPLSTLYRNANKIATWYDNNPQKRIMNIQTPYRLKEILDKSVYEEYSEHKFENLNVEIVKQYDIFLRKIYGDYMQLPPLENRNTRHHLIELKLD
jgi:lipopolysaccharide cholinephosphotransferase